MNCIIALIIYTGLQFWKAPNRKIFAVSQANLDALDEGTSDSEEDELVPSATKKMKQEIKNTMKNIKEELVTIQSAMSRSTPDLDPIMQQLNGLIKCCICQMVPLKPPVAISKCCKSIIGCGECVERLVSSPGGSTCPLCRAANFETMRINGFDGIISEMNNTTA